MQDISWSISQPPEAREIDARNAKRTGPQGWAASLYYSRRSE
jgi:hypothetical protein